MLPPDSHPTQADPVAPVSQAPLSPHHIRLSCQEQLRATPNKRQPSAKLLHNPDPGKVPLTLAQLRARPLSSVPLPYLSHHQAPPGFIPSLASRGVEPPAMNLLCPHSSIHLALHPLSLPATVHPVQESAQPLAHGPSLTQQGPVTVMSLPLIQWQMAESQGLCLVSQKERKGEVCPRGRKEKIRKA